MRRFITALVFGFMFIVSSSFAQERVGIGYSMIDDGGCPEVGHILVAEYDLQLDQMDAHGRVRTAPSSGDCRQDSLSYDVNIARYFSMGTFDLMVEFGANEQAASAPYALTMNGVVIPRPSDGNPLLVQILPAGAATTVVGVFGLSRTYGPVRVSGGYNFVPVDWFVDGMVQPGRSVQFGASYDHSGFGADMNVNMGRMGNFGEITAGYQFVLDPRFDLGLSISHRWGINAADVGVHYSQTIEEAVYLLQGGPRNHATFASVTLGYSLR